MLLRRAEAQARRILEEAEKEAEEKYKATIKRGEDRIKVEEQQMTTLFEIENKNRLLQVKEELVEKAFERALKRLQEYTLTEDYRECLIKLIAEASRHVNSEKIIVELNEKDHQRLTEKDLLEISERIGVKLVRSEKTIDSIGGVIIKSFDGKVTVDNTFENRLKTLRNTLRSRIAKILFKEGS